MSDLRNKPCATCPYRRETKKALWSEEEYINLRAQDSNEFGGRSFGCHCDAQKPEADRELCVGWLLDQKRRNVPSIQLRLLLMTKPPLAALFNALSEAGLSLYRSIDEMHRANFPPRRRRSAR